MTKWYVDILSDNDIELFNRDIEYKNGKPGYRSSLTGEWFEVELVE